MYMYMCMYVYIYTYIYIYICKNWPVKNHMEHLLNEIAKYTGANIHDLRNDSHQELRSERVENALHFCHSPG